MKPIFFVIAFLAILPFNSLAVDEPFKAGDMMFRLRVIDVIPHEKSNTSVGGSVSVTSRSAPEIDLTYFITPNISLELIAATTKHNLQHSTGLDAGSAYVLPPTLMLQYHVTQWENIIPYAGLGINYTYFYNEKGGDLGSVKYTDDVGPALQLGVDIPVAENWYFNIDAKKLFIDTDAKFSSGVRAQVDIDPLVIGAGFGYKF